MPVTGSQTPSQLLGKPSQPCPAGPVPLPSPAWPLLPRSLLGLPQHPPHSKATHSLVHCPVPFPETGFVGFIHCCITNA